MTPPPSDLSFLHPPKSADELGWLSYYRVLRRIGAGGMGLVFEAEDSRLERRVALKVMKPELAEDPVSRTRFLREARAVAAIRSPHIVTVFNVGIDGGVPFIAMELLTGQSLRDRIDAGQKLTVPEVLELGKEICLGLSAAHHADLVHRDIKPENLWLEVASDSAVRVAPSGGDSSAGDQTVEIRTPHAATRPSVKILDFGLARFAARPDNNVTGVGFTVGTPRYMAPEQARGQRIDPRTDLFSLGCVLYELLTGQCPFARGSVMASLSALATEDPVPPRTHNSEIPPGLERLVLQLLAKNPDERPPSAEAVARSLSGIARQHAGEAVSGSGQHTPAPRMPSGFDLVETERPDFDAETRDLLRHRLRSVALVGMVGLAFMMANDLFWHGLTYPIFRGLVVFSNVVSYLLLRGSRPLSTNQLRALELWLFAVGGLVLTVIPGQDMLDSAAAGEYSLAVAERMGAAFGWSMLILGYAIYIPNTWRRAALVIVPMSLIPSLTLLVLEALSPRLKEAFDLPFFNMPISFPTLAGVIGIYGVYVINSLRQRAFNAQLLGQYILGELLARGPLGEVFRGEHYRFKRPSAIKVIPTSETVDAETLARFERVLRVATTLNHPGIVTVYDYGRTREKSLYIVMELVPGMTAASIVQDYGPLPPGRVVHLLRQACEALAEAHSFGFLHRNLKPTNLIVSRHHRVYDAVRLLDFGLDRNVSGKPVAAEAALYMAPEQATGGAVDARSDAYSLGALGYFLLTGRPVFPATNLMQLVVAHSRDPVDPPSRHAAVPSDLEAVILRCLEKDPQRRFPSAHELDRALGACACASDWTDAQAGQWWQFAD